MFPRLRRLPVFTFALFSALSAAAKPVVVCSFGIPADWASETGGPAIAVASLTPPRSDFHALQPTPAQVKALVAADLVVGIHPDLETWLADLEKAGNFRRPVLWLGKPILGEHAADTCGHAGHVHHHDEEDEHDEHDQAACATPADPHVWMDPDTAAALATALAAELEKLAPAAAPAIRARTVAYTGALHALTAELATTLATVPAGRRHLVSQHDNLRRFAAKFGFTVSGTLLRSASSEAADPSAKQFAAVVATIHREKIPAIFADNTLSGDLPAAVAAEAGLPPPVTLAIDALDRPGTPAGTYAGMMRDNARRIAEALAPTKRKTLNTEH